MTLMAFYPDGTLDVADLVFCDPDGTSKFFYPYIVVGARIKKGGKPVKSKVLSLAGGVFLLVSITAAAAEITVPLEAGTIEMDASGKVLSYVIEGPADTFTPEEATPPGRWASCTTIPTLITPPNGSNLTTIAPLFQWNLHTSPAATMMMMDVGLDAGFLVVVTNMSSTQKTGVATYRFGDNFDPATTYYWRSRLVCGGGYGPYSEVWSFTTGSGGVILPAPAVISPPDGATVLLGSAPVRLDWSPVSGAVEYQIQRRNAGSLGGNIYRRTETYLDVFYLDKNTTYEWWVKARNTYGYGTESVIRQFRQNLILESGDYDGDGSKDIAIFRDNVGLWAVRGLTRIYFGTNYDIPVSGDYNGDGTTEPAIFRGSAGLWAARGVTRVYFGDSSDLPIPADYNGDGSCDVGIFRGASGLWALRGLTRFYFGTSGDTPIPGDYANSGQAEPAIFRSSTGLWAWRNVTRAYYGRSGDWPVPGDYFGSDYAPTIFRGSNGLWAVMNRTKLYFGANGDAPVPGDYNGAAGDEIAIFRDSIGLWAVRGITRVYFGTDDDLPVTR